MNQEVKKVKKVKGKIHYMIDDSMTACGKNKAHDSKLVTTRNPDRVTCPDCKDEME